VKALKARACGLGSGLQDLQARPWACTSPSWARAFRAGLPGLQGFEPGPAKSLHLIVCMAHGHLERLGPSWLSISTRRSGKLEVPYHHLSFAQGLTIVTGSSSQAAQCLQHLVHTDDVNDKSSSAQASHPINIHDDNNVKHTTSDYAKVRSPHSCPPRPCRGIVSVPFLVVFGSYRWCHISTAAAYCGVVS